MSHANRTAGDPAGERHDYGEDPSQYGVLHRPAGTPRGVVVIIHGGFWRAEYDLSYGTPLATALAGGGWTAWNLEYRRVGSGPGGGGGTPATFDDVAAGIDHLAQLDLGIDLATAPVVGLGHSAGGHLAVWAAGRDGATVSLTHAISQAGVVDLRAADAEGLGGGAVRALLGHPPGDADDRYDPIRQVPLPVPVWCVHGAADDTVPISQSVAYVAAARSAGGTADLVRVEGGHFEPIDPTSSAWMRQRRILDGIG